MHQLESATSESHSFLCVHSTGHSIFLKRVRGRTVSLKTTCFKILGSLDVFFSTDQHNLHYYASRLSLGSANFNLQQFSCFLLPFIVETPYMTTHFINRSNEVFCSTNRPNIHDFDISVYHRSIFRFYMSTRRPGRVRPCFLVTREEIMPNRAPIYVHIHEDTLVCHLHDGMRVCAGKSCIPHV